MREKTLNFLGLMRRANAIAIGETNTGSAARSGKAKLWLIASDASENAQDRARGFAAGRGVTAVQLPFTKEEISAHVGVSGCSMAAVTDIGFANALMKSLALISPEKYGDMAGSVLAEYARTQERRDKASAGKRNKRIGKRRNSV